jgi:hypothetical protein
VKGAAGEEPEGAAFKLCHGNACRLCRVVGFRLLDVDGCDDYTPT